MFKSLIIIDLMLILRMQRLERNTVLYLMQKHGYITTEEEKLAKSVSVESLATDIKTNATTHEYQGYIDTVTEEIRKYNVNPYVTPLLVYTNMSRDNKMQLITLLTLIHLLMMLSKLRISVFGFRNR